MTESDPTYLVKRSFDRPVEPACVRLPIYSIPAKQNALVGFL